MKKKKKLKNIATIKRRLFRLASQKCRESANDRCEICGMKKGDILTETGKPQRVEAHHVMSRDNINSPLKYDLRNLICLCTRHHKTHLFSAHKHALWFAEEFKKIRPDDYQWILDHSNDKVNLDDRNVLEIIEKCLKQNLPLDLESHNIEYLQKGENLTEHFDTLNFEDKDK